MKRMKLRSIYSLAFIAVAMIGLLWQFAPRGYARDLTEEQAKKDAYELLKNSEDQSEATIPPPASERILVVAGPQPYSNAHAAIGR